ncbi:hypothetical protein SDC9_209311 [bioreactor metagenome]|uniref:Uncharacterized protein n=1 Tax=bioreactor metagenome TaxID=1076179 RepID=A0A645JPS6_9ZZZZ
MHLNQTADALPLVLGRVLDIGSADHNAGVNPGEGEAAYEGVGCDFERQSGHRSFVRRIACGRLTVFIGSGNSRNVDGGRQVVDNGVNHFLNTLVFVG